MFLLILLLLRLSHSLPRSFYPLLSITKIVCTNVSILTNSAHIFWIPLLIFFLLEMTSFFAKKRTLFLRHSKFPFRFLFLKPLQNPQSPCTYFPRASLIRPFSTKSNNLPEYQMPSVTWGVVQGRKEKLVSRVIISDYLKNIGYGS